MNSQLQRPRDVIAGLLIVAIGLAFLLAGRGMEFGTSFRMGPGYFPMVLSALTMLLGAALTLNGLRGARVEGAFGNVPWIGFASVIGAAVFFGLTIRGLGIAPATAIVVFATASASRYARWTSSALLAIGMAAFCTLVFVRALGLPLPSFGPWLTTAYWAPTPVAAPAQ